MGNFDILAVRNITAIMDELQDVRQVPAPYLFTGRIPMVPAVDGEIMARYTGRVVAADIIMNDQKAVVRAANPVRLQQVAIPNLKHGELVTQDMMSVLQRIEANQPSRRDVTIFEDYLTRRTMELRDGVYARMEALNVAMLIDAFSYDRLGVKVTGGTWGMPSDLKVTPITPWSTAATAGPVTDLLTVKRIASQKYGINLDRATMSTQALLYMTATTEFKNMAALSYFGQAIPATGLPTQATQIMTTLATSILGMDIEIYDAQTWTEEADGTQAAVRYLPENKVVLTSKAADGNSMMWDWANGVVMETMRGAVPGVIGEFEEEREGPLGYATSADPTGNPPGVILWGVGRGFPRKHKEAASAVLTVY
jgi:hypothetical protein